LCDAAFRNISDPEFFWHIKTGEMILADLAIRRRTLIPSPTSVKLGGPRVAVPGPHVPWSHDNLGYTASVLLFAAIGVASAMVMCYMMRKLDVAEWLAMACSS
jgi:hypothetical protein